MVGVGVVDTAAVDVLGLGLSLPLAHMVGVAVGVRVVGSVAVVVDAVGHGVVREAAGVDEGGVSLSVPLAVVVGIAIGVGVGMAVAVVVDAVGHGVVDSVDSGAVDKGGVSLSLGLALVEVAAIEAAVGVGAVGAAVGVGGGVVAGVAVVEELGVGLGHGGGHEAKEDESLHGDADWMLVSLVVRKTVSESRGSSWSSCCRGTGG